MVARLKNIGDYVHLSELQESMAFKFLPSSDVRSTLIVEYNILFYHTSCSVIQASTRGTKKRSIVGRDHWVWSLGETACKHSVKIL